MSDQWLIEANEIAATVARQVRSRYPTVYFDQADVQQELMAWVLKRESKVRGWLDPTLETPERKANIKQLAKSMNREADKYCRSHKAKMSGYETRDEAFYTMTMIEELITHLEEIENMSSNQTGNVRVSNGGSDPATANNYLASVIDVKAALESLEPTDQLMLEMKYKENLTLAQMADALGLSDSTISRRIHSALRKMTKYLGGESPWGGIGSRRVISNSQAQSLLE